MGIWKGEDDNGQVPSHTEHVGSKKKSEKYNLPLWVVCQSKKNKIC
jgi:hypothetical protein